MHTAPALFAAVGFIAGILFAHAFRFLPGLLGIALLGCFLVTATCESCCAAES
jgi:hypothetical protein